MAINYNELRDILERKANRAIKHLDELKCFVPEFREVLDSVLYISETLKDLTFLDTDCPDCKKEEIKKAPVELDKEKLILREYKALDASIKKSDFVVLFYSEGCEPCKLMKPLAIEVTKELGITLEQVSVDDEIGLAHASDYEVKAWPKIFIIKDNRIVSQILGYNSENTSDQIKAELKNSFRNFLRL